MFATPNHAALRSAVWRPRLVLAIVLAWAFAGHSWAWCQAPAGDTSAARQKSPTEGAASQLGDKLQPADLQFLDTDGNGAVSRAEWNRFIQSFGRLDADKDAALDAGELQPLGAAADLVMKLADANADAKIARAEWTRLARGFNRFDANRDASLDAAELASAAQALEAAASGGATLPGSSGKANAGPTLWRGRIEGDSQIELLVVGNRIAGREIGPEGGRSLGAGTYVMTGNGQAGNMDAMYTEGPHSGQVCPGIYRFEKETLYWCVNNIGVRPLELRTGQGNWLMVLKRVETGPPEQASK